MIRLQNVSKFYYSKGMIASGITKVNLELGIGEFVVITGESGSGKSTLLNVISGLDSYEEGEMYIEGHETSHYTQSDFENYRKKYIGNIFQSFNLVGSYTVYQNVALALEIDGKSKEEIKGVVPEILERVGMSQYAKTKVSKLSGGQKQRVAIARALAKDTDIIVADEPTGNLDSVSAAGIVELLTSIAKDKLVIVVTHNFDQFENYATRVIKMHDGRIVEDKLQIVVEEKTEPAETEEKPLKQAKEKGMRGGTVVKLGVRNTFNVIPKFVLLLIVFLFLVMSVSSQYASLLSYKAETELMGYNPYFSNYSSERIVLKRTDCAEMTQDDYDIINSISHVDTLIKDDTVYDTSGYMENDYTSFWGFTVSLSSFPDGELTYGRMPEGTNEVVVTVPEGSWFLEGNDIESLMGSEFRINTDNGYNVKVTLVGAMVVQGSTNYFNYSDGTVYVSDEILTDARKFSYATQSNTQVRVNGTYYGANDWNPFCGIEPNANVEKGKILVSADCDYMYDSGYCYGSKWNFKVSNAFYEEELELTVGGTYTKNNFKTKLGEDSFDEKSGKIFMNPADYNTLYNKGNYQASVIVDSVRNVNAVADDLEEAGYKCMVLKDHLIGADELELLYILRVPMSFIFVIAIFFICYFVSRLILKSRSSYFAIMRMLGTDRKRNNRIMTVELMLVCFIAFIIFAVLFYISKYVVAISALENMVYYLHVRELVILAVIVLFMAFLISRRFMRSMFKQTAMNAYREEV